MFVVSEFSTGMVRTLLIRGINRFSFYFSKLVTVIVIPVIYTIFSCAASFAAGCYLWGMGEATNSIILNIVKSLAMFLAVQAALHSIYVMTVFLVRHSGAVVSANLALVIPIIPSLLCWLIETVLVKWFNIHKNVSEYWIGNYTSVDQIGLSHAFVVKILLISSVYFAVSTAIGCITFWKRDV
jgi:ABC-2 type transport system permease protein